MAILSLFLCSLFVCCVFQECILSLLCVILLDMGEEKKNGWGGRRAGAGRKPLYRVHFHSMLDKDVAEFVRMKAKTEKRPIGEIIEEYILVAEADEGYDKRDY